MHPNGTGMMVSEDNVEGTNWAPSSRAKVVEWLISQGYGDDDPSVPGKASGFLHQRPPQPDNSSRPACSSLGTRVTNTRTRPILARQDVSLAAEGLAKKEDNEDFKRMFRAAARGGDSRTVPKTSVERHLADLIYRKRECKMAPFVVVYFVVFALMLILHENTPDLSQVERNVIGMLEGTTFEGYNTWAGGPISGHKVLEDIATKEDIYTYLQDAILPLFVPELSTTQQEDMVRVLRYNHLIGGLHLQQIRNKPVDCAVEYDSLGPKKKGVNPILANFSCYLTDPSLDCFGPGRSVEGFCPAAEEDESTETIVPSRRLSPRSRAAMSRLDNDRIRSGQVFVVTLQEHRGLGVAQETVRRLQHENWLDLQTIHASIRMLLLNPDLGVFCSVTVNLIFAPSGAIVPEAKAVTFLAEPYRSLGVVVLDISFLVLWLHMLLVCARSLRGAYRQQRTGEHHVRTYFVNASTVIELGSVCGGLAIMVLWVVYMLKLSEMVTLADSVLEARPGPGGGASSTYSQEARRLKTHISKLDDFMSSFRVYTVWYTLCLIFRFFRVFMAQPRLAVMVSTMVKCLPELVHFSIISVIMVSSFTVSGMFLFGHRMLNFSSFSLGLQTSLQIIFGNFEFEELVDEYPETASIWFFCFIVVLALLMLNMTLAIVLDTYSSVKNSSALLDSVWDQISMFTDDIRHRNTRVSDVSLLKAVLQIEHEQVGTSDLCDNCPGLSAAQATALLEKVIVIETTKDNVSLGLSDATRLMALTKDLFLVIAHQVGALLKLQADNVTLRARHTWLSSLKGPPGWSPGKRPPEVVLAHGSAAYICVLEERLGNLEGILNEAVSYLVFRSKEARERMTIIEDAIRQSRLSPATQKFATADREGLSGCQKREMFKA